MRGPVEQKSIDNVKGRIYLKWTKLKVHFNETL